MHFQPWPYPIVVAHRGGGHCAPENTLAGMQMAYQLGYKGIECDAMLAADQVPVLMHDSEGGRTIAQRGSIAQWSSKELKAMDAGAWFNKIPGQSFKNEPVPLLKELLQFCHEQALWMNIEIKPVPGFETITGHKVAEQVMQYCARWPHDPAPVLSSFSQVALEAAKKSAPAIPRALLFDTVPEDWIEILKQVEGVSVHCNYRTLNVEQIRAIKSKGYWLFCYTVNELTEAKTLLEWGIDGFCTDRLDLFKDFTQ